MMKKFLLMLVCQLMISTAHAVTVVVTRTADSGPGSLRDALTKINAETDSKMLHQIIFQIPVSDEGYNKATDSWSIKPLTALPTIISPVDINGYSCSGATVNTQACDQAHTAHLKIELQGPGTQVHPMHGLILGLGSDGSTIRGLCINRFVQGSGIVIQSNNNKIQGCFIGSDCTGMLSISNTAAISNEGEDNLIGGTLPADRNLLSGSYGPLGVISKPLGTVSILGNLIGLNREGTQVLASESQVGIYFGGSHFNPSTIANNVIAGNTLVNVYLHAFPYGAPVTVEGNKIGTDCSGSHAIKGNGIGLALFTAPSYFSSDSTYQTVQVKGNVISGNTYGIVVRSCVPVQARGVDVEISDNIIGLNAQETQPVSNSLDGLFLDTSYGSVIKGNRIGGNGGSGIKIGQTRGVLMQSNFIGVNTAAHPQPNGLNRSNKYQVPTVSGPLVRGASLQGNSIDSHRLEDTSLQDATLRSPLQKLKDIVVETTYLASPNGSQKSTLEEAEKSRRRRMANLRRR